MTEAHPDNSTGGASRDDEGATAALGLAERLCPPATPTFAIMALLTGLGGSPRNSQDLWIGVPVCGKISCREGTKMSERSGTLDDDPFRGRRPTSHERMTGLPWEASYHDGPAPWDIGQPQPAIVRLASAGGFVGAVLDAGCGTGENALLVASLGLSVLGVDVAETALAMAREKAHDRGIAVEFAAADALQLERLGRMFQTVLDCGLFHTFDGDERPGYVASLASVTERDRTLLCCASVTMVPIRARTPSVRES
jgi:hypothetical protein